MAYLSYRLGTLQPFGGETIWTHNEGIGANSGASHPASTAVPAKLDSYSRRVLLDAESTSKLASFSQDGP